MRARFENAVDGAFIGLVVGNLSFFFGEHYGSFLSVSSPNLRLIILALIGVVAGVVATGLFRLSIGQGEIMKGVIGGVIIGITMGIIALVLQVLITLIFPGAEETPSASLTGSTLLIWLITVVFWVISAAIISAIYAGLIQKLASGDFGLAITYWVYGVLVGIIANGLSNVVTSVGGWVILILIYTAYSIPVLMGIWRASTKYEGPKIWAGLAKVSVLLDIVSLAFGLLLVLGTFGQA